MADLSAMPDYSKPEPSGVDILEALESDNFSLGDLQVIRYNLKTAHMFPDNFMSQLYVRMKKARILARTFCGMINLHHDAIVQFLIGKPCLAAVKWLPDRTAFDVLGFGFITTWIGVPPPEPGPRSAFGAYLFLPEAWGSQDAELLGMLGLAHMFRTYGLLSIYGQRYSDNRHTARFMERFGFKDIGEIPDFLLRRRPNGELWLAPCTVSRIDRVDFVHYVEARLISLLERRGGT